MYYINGLPKTLLILLTYLITTIPMRMTVTTVTATATGTGPGKAAAAASTPTTAPLTAISDNSGWSNSKNGNGRDISKDFDINQDTRNPQRDRKQQTVELKHQIHHSSVAQASDVDISTSGAELLLSPSSPQDMQFIAALVSSSQSNHDDEQSIIGSSSIGSSSIGSSSSSVGVSAGGSGSGGFAVGDNNYHYSSSSNVMNMDYNSLDERNSDQQKLNEDAVEETTYPPPVFDFGMPRNITARSGQTAAINCRVEHLGDKSVSWIRKRDLHILTAGIFTYTTDERFKVIHTTNSKDWTLHLKYAQPRDSGVYECQISTEPKMSMAFRLNVIVTPPDAKAIITGPADLYVKVGSAITLTCHVKQPSSVQDIGPIYWYRGPYILTPFVTHPNEAAIDMQRISMESQLGEKLQSRLRIANAQTGDSGNYTCMPTTADAASVLVNVINDESPAAMQKSSAASLYRNSIIHKLTTTVVRWCWHEPIRQFELQWHRTSLSLLPSMMHINCLPSLMKLLQYSAVEHRMLNTTTTATTTTFATTTVQCTMQRDRFLRHQIWPVTSASRITATNES